MGWEQRIVEALQRSVGEGGFLTGIRMFTYVGDWYVWLALSPYVLWKYAFWGYFKMLLHCGGLGFLSIVTYRMIKRKTGRPRPYVKYEGVKKLLTPSDEFAFPSGHTMNNMVVGLGFSLYEPWVFPFAVAVPLLWGGARTILGIHYPTDVLAGALLAFVIFLASQLVPIKAFLFPM